MRGKRLISDSHEKTTESEIWFDVSNHIYTSKHI